MSGLTLSGTGNSGPQTFQFPDVRVGGDQRQWSVPPDRGPYHYFRAGLLQFGVTGPALFDSIPCGRPFASVPQALIAAGCIPDCNPIRLGQTLTITDAGGSQVEQWVVQNRALIPLGPQVPQWCGSAFTAATFAAPFTLTPSNFQAGDTWQRVIPPLLKGDF